MRRVYLDYNATTPVDPAVREAMLPYLGENFGNPSSLHWAGSRARKAIEEAREKIAACLSCNDREIIFTSGGTEGINLALKGVVSKVAQRGGSTIPHVVTSLIEHQAVLQSLESMERDHRIAVTRLPVNEEGEIDLDELKQSLRENTILVSIMFANNEIGNVYPVNAIGQEIRKVARERGILFHTDAVQAVGKLPVDLSMLPIDLLSFSSHKIYGPKGVGALYIRKGVNLGSMIHGGAQEMERRGGTENVPGIVGFGEAMVRIHRDLQTESSRQASLRDRLQAGLGRVIPGIHFHGNENHRVPNTLNATFEGIRSETILIALDREGIAVSSGSACASGALEPSHVLLAMGVPREEAKGAVRFSLGRGTKDDDIDYVLEKLPEIVERLCQR